MNNVNMDTISIIVPVYNVENLLDRCVESILKQSYSNLEVLLIDDGSTDNSGQKCDDWAKKDSRVRVIHKENGGLSSARNAGIDAAAGKYFAFVDSDDYIAEEMIEKLHDALIMAKADMSICNLCMVDECGTPVSGLKQILPITDSVMSGVEAVMKTSGKSDWIYLVAWNKLYSRRLFKEIRFPLGKLCEDAFIMHRLLKECSLIAEVSYIGYMYVQRNNSITHSKSITYYVNEAEAHLDRAIFAYNLGLVKCAGNAYWRTAMSLVEAFREVHIPTAIKDERTDIIGNYRNNINIKKGCALKKRMQATTVYISPYLYRVLFRNPLRQYFKRCRET